MRERASIAITPTEEDVRIAYLAALAVAIHVAESVIPSPLPGVKPGLANIVVVVVLTLYGLRAAAWVAVLRVLAGGLIAGSLLAPTFFMSAGGTAAALAGLAAGRAIPGLGPVGFSVLASVCHILGQFFVAWALFVPHPSLWTLLPLLLTGALILGGANGILAAGISRHLTRPGAPP